MAQVLRVGKHKGRSFEEAADDRGYSAWILREQGLSRSLQKISQSLVKQHAAIVTVGKHKGKFFDEVQKPDPDYCQWVCSLEDPNFFEAFQEYLKQDKDEENIEPPTKKPKQSNAEKCKICYDKDISCVFVPCGHLVACLRCGVRIDRESGACPICQKDIALVTQTYAA